MPRIEDLSDAQRQAVLNFACFEYDSVPFVPLRHPLQKIKLGLVTTAGLHCRGDRPFSPGDQSYRVIPVHTSERDILQSHNSIGFDRTAIYRDLNVTLPCDSIDAVAVNWNGLGRSLDQQHFQAGPSCGSAEPCRSV